MTERVFHCIQEPKNGDSFIDLGLILKEGFVGDDYIGKGNLDYANAILAGSISKDEKKTFMRIVGKRSKLPHNYGDMYALELTPDGEYDASTTEMKRNWRAIESSSSKSIQLIYIMFPHDTTDEDTIKKREFYKSKLGKYNIPLEFCKEFETEPDQSN
ncbi:MAG: hypothetical protein JW754_03050 [Candidatus Aenigmarchaeota archaeon]|nr:hypothetical protein [Candidatus Aenigmarchaeota archaeon]